MARARVLACVLARAAGNGGGGDASAPEPRVRAAAHAYGGEASEHWQDSPLQARRVITKEIVKRLPVAYM